MKYHMIEQLKLEHNKTGQYSMVLVVRDRSTMALSVSFASSNRLSPLCGSTPMTDNAEGLSQFDLTC